MQGEGTGKARIRQDNLQRIREAAEVVFGEKGFSAATMSDIARHAGLPKANLHYYFGRKEDLYQAVLEGILEEWFGGLRDWTASSPPLEAIRGYVRRKLDFSRSRPHASRIFAAEIIYGNNAVTGLFGPELLDLLRTRVAVIDDWARAGQIPVCDGRHLLFMIWALTQYYADFNAQVRFLLEASELGDGAWEGICAEVEGFVLRALRLA